MDAKQILSGSSVFLLTAPAVWAGFSQQLTPIEAASAIEFNQLSPSAIAVSQSQVIAQQAQVKQGEVYKLMNGGATHTRQSSTLRAKTNPRTDIIPRDLLTTDTTSKAEILFKQQDTKAIARSSFSDSESKAFWSWDAEAIATHAGSLMKRLYLSWWMTSG